MNQYLYEIYYLFKNKNYHILIFADSDEKCYELALKNIKEEHLSELDKSLKEGLELDINVLLDAAGFLPPSISTYLFKAIQNSKRYFIEESSVLKVEELN
jgi:hypothetical protein